MIIDKRPDQLKMPFAFWTRQAVAGVIHQELGIEMPIRTAGEYLKRWSMTPQKPVKNAYEQIPKEVQQWLDEECPQSKRKRSRRTQRFIGLTRPGFTVTASLVEATPHGAKRRSSRSMPSV